MATKSGDDYAARVYVAFSLPKDSHLFGAPAPSSPWPADLWRHRARRRAQLRGTTGKSEASGAPMPTAQTQMVVQRSGAALSGRWVHVPRPARRRRQVVAPRRQARDAGRGRHRQHRRAGDGRVCGPGLLWRTRRCAQRGRGFPHAQMHVHALHRRAAGAVAEVVEPAIKITWLSEANTKMSTVRVIAGLHVKEAALQRARIAQRHHVDKTLARVVRHHRRVNQPGVVPTELAQAKEHAPA